MKDIRITPIKLRQVPALRRQFVYAANSSFAYLPKPDRQQVIRENGYRSLVFAQMHPHRLLLGAWQENTLVGYAIGSVNDDTAMLYWLYVSPDIRGQRVGLRLLEATCALVSQKGATELRLVTYDHRPYYERQGFKHRDRQPFHGVDMDIMSLELIRG